MGRQFFAAELIARFTVVDDDIRKRAANIDTKSISLHVSPPNRLFRAQINYMHLTTLHVPTAIGLMISHQPNRDIARPPVAFSH